MPEKQKPADVDLAFYWLITEFYPYYERFYKKSIAIPRTTSDTPFTDWIAERGFVVIPPELRCLDQAVKEVGEITSEMKEDVFYSHTDNNLQQEYWVFNIHQIFSWCRKNGVTHPLLKANDPIKEWSALWEDKRSSMGLNKSFFDTDVKDAVKLRLDVWAGKEEEEKTGTGKEGIGGKIVSVVERWLGKKAACVVAGIILVIGILGWLVGLLEKIRSFWSWIRPF
jgi:hypothetical protein